MSHAAPPPQAPLFSRVLIANRGEIAVRIANTLHALGLTAVAVYSDADRHAPHVSACEAAYRLGPAPAVESYLRRDAIIAAALAAGAEAIHPGYGFLAEDADFAAATAAAGLTFIGPPVAAMRTMGQKTTARAAMARVGVPTVPGSTAALPSEPAAALAAAEALGKQFGYPLMLKAAAGGGGKGMRRVDAAAALPHVLRAAASEAHSAFGDAALYIEKALRAPRHIEVQVFADAAGEIYILGARECSMQRRHQKVIEETPAPGLTAATLSRLGEVARRAAAAVDYRGAGTIEFLLDDDESFYFLEMNTRLQVEHAVTEVCYGLDLVAAQLAVAQGQPLDFGGRTLHARGHAIEARLYAEDPCRDFMPCPGAITALRLPAGPGVRVDCGVSAPGEVSVYYDPLLAKIIAWGATRDQARRRLQAALRVTYVGGICTNLAFLQRLLAERCFVEGCYTTHTIDELRRDPAFMAPAALPAEDDAVLIAAALAATRAAPQRKSQPQPPSAAAASAAELSAWQQPQRLAWQRLG